MAEKGVEEQVLAMERLRAYTAALYTMSLSEGNICTEIATIQKH